MDWRKRSREKFQLRSEDGLSVNGMVLMQTRRSMGSVDGLSNPKLKPETRHPNPHRSLIADH